MTVTEEQIERLAATAAKKAIGEMFEIFGVNVSTHDGRRMFADDMSFLRAARQGSTRFSIAALGGIAVSVATGIGYLMWTGFKAVVALASKV